VLDTPSPTPIRPHLARLIRHEWANAGERIDQPTLFCTVLGLVLCSQLLFPAALLPCILYAAARSLFFCPPLERYGTVCPSPRPLLILDDPPSCMPALNYSALYYWILITYDRFRATMSTGETHVVVC
jgi:hypothetical protein